MTQPLSSIRSLPPGTAEHVRGLVDEVFGPGYWEGFQGYICEPADFHEWRFGGTLGFGGKVHLNGRGLYVSCYPEDLTPELDDLIARVNRRLEEVVHRG